MSGKHPSHKTRISMDASTYDEICELCGNTDKVPGGWGKLAEPCPAAPKDKDASRIPRRFRYALPEGKKHPNGSDCRFRYGCYFPLTDLVILDMGERGTGKPEWTEVNIEWLDEEKT